MLKISEIESSDHWVKLNLEGRLVGPWVTELRGYCEQMLAAGRALHLRLAEVDYLDQNGLNLLTNLRRRGVKLLSCSPFVDAQLRSGSEN